MSENKSRMPDLGRIFGNRVFRRGGFSFLACAVALAIAVVINLVAGALPASVIHLDTTMEKLYTLDEQTVRLVRGLNEDVTLTYLVQAGSEDETVLEYLDRYEGLSDHLKVRNVDPDMNPSFVQGFTETIGSGDIIVEGSRRHKIIPKSDLYKYDENSYYAYLYGMTSDYQVDFAGESELTSALDYVTSEKLPHLYQITGHGEAAIQETWQNYLRQENVEWDEVNLLSAGKVPENCDVLWICSPTSDYTPEEAEAVKEYLYNGGSLLLFTDYIEAQTPNFSSIMEAYGLSVTDGFIVEGDLSHTANQTPYYLLPDLESHAVTDPLISARLPVMISLPRGIEEKGASRSSVQVTPLLKTSPEAYSKIGGLSIETWEQEPDDIAGPFDVAVAVEETFEGGTTRIVWITTTSVLEDSFSSYTGGADANFVLNALGWVCEHESAVTVRTKDFSRQYLSMNSGTALIFAGIVAIVIPLAALAAGLVIWIRRRRK